MKITIQIDNGEVQSILSKPIDEVTQEDQCVIDQEKAKLPRKAIKLPKDEAMIDPGQNAKPLEYVVKKGDTLKSICEKYAVSYGELSNHLMNTEGTTSIYKGMKLEIPRHFVDLTEAI